MEMLKQSTTLAVVGQLDAASSTDQLTAITKSYNVAVEDTSQIVDKLVAVDLNYAASTGEISTALQKVASSAGQAGLGLDKLIGLITISEEKTRQAPEVIGSAWQSIIARIGKITAKVDLDDLVDENGKVVATINDADKVLSKYGINLVDTSGKMRDMGTIMDEIGAKWGQMSTLEQNQLAYVVAGVRQRNVFIAAMEDYNRVLEATSVAENANGVAAEKMTVYNESLEAAQNRLTASVQQFAQDSNLDRTLALAYDGLSKVVEILNILLNKIPVLSPLIKAMGVTLATAFAGAIIKNMISTSKMLKGIVSAAPGVVSAFANMATGAGTFGAVVEAAGGPLTIILGLLSAFIAIAPSVASWWQKMFPSTEKKAEDAKNALEESNSALEETNSKIKETQDQIAEIDSKDALTLTDQAEKERLEEELDTLQQIKQVQEDIANAKKTETLQATKDVISEKYATPEASVDDYLGDMQKGYRSANVYDTETASIEELTASIKYCKEAKESLSETDSQYQEKLNEINQTESESRQALLSKKQELLDYKQQLIELGDTSSEEYQLVNDKINDITIALDPSKFPKIDLGEMIETSGMENKIKMVVQSGSEAGKKVAESYAKELAEGIENDPVSLEAWREALNIPDGQELGVDQLTQEILSLFQQMYGGISEASESAAQGFTDQHTALDAYQEAVQNIHDNTTDLTAAYQDMIDKGYISESVVKKLTAAHPGLVKELVLENGQYKINLQTLKDVYTAEVNKSIASIEAEKKQTQATVEAINKRILAFELEKNALALDPNATKADKTKLIGLQHSIDMSKAQLKRLQDDAADVDKYIIDLQKNAATWSPTSKKSGSKKSGKSDAEKEFEKEVKQNIKNLKGLVTKYSKDIKWDDQATIDAYITQYNSMLDAVVNNPKARKIAAEQLGVDLSLYKTEQEQIDAVTVALKEQAGTISEAHQKLVEKDLQAQQKIISAAKEAATAEKKEYDDALKNIQNLESTVESMLEKGISLLEKAGDLLFDMLGKISDRYDKQLDNLDKISDELDKQKDAFEDKIDQQKELLKLQKEEMDNADELADKNNAIADIDAQLMELQYDNSAEAQAKRLKLLDERAQKEKDLADWQKDNDYDAKIDALDKEKSEYEKTIEAEKKALEAQKKTIEDTQKSFENTLSKIQSGFNSFTNFLNSDLIKRTLSKVLISYGGDNLKNLLYVYNDIFGDGLRSTIDQTWDYAYDSMKKFNWSEGTWIGDLENLLSGGSYDAQQRINILEKGSTQLSELLKKVQAGQFDMSKAFGSGGFNLSNFTDTVKTMSEKFGAYKDSVLGGLQSVNDGILSSLKKTGSTVASLFESFTKGSAGAIEASESGANGIISTAIKGIKSIFGASDGAVSKITTNGITSMNSFSTSGQGIISNLGNFAVKALESVGNTTGGIVQTVFKGIYQMVSGLGQGIGKIGSAIGGLFGIGGGTAATAGTVGTGATIAGGAGLAGIAGTVGTGLIIGAGVANAVGGLVGYWKDTIGVWKDKDKNFGQKLGGTLLNFAKMMIPGYGLYRIGKALFGKHHTGADYVKKQNPMLDKMLGLGNDETVSILKVGEAVVPTWANSASSSASNNRFTGSPFGSAVDTAVKSARANSRTYSSSDNSTINISMPINIQGDADSTTVNSLRKEADNIVNRVLKTINSQTRIGGYKNIKAATV